MTIEMKLTADEYNALRFVDGKPAFTSTLANALRRMAPAKAIHQAQNPRTSKAFDMGTLVHSLVLEPEKRDYVVVEADSWRTKAAKEAADEARAQGLLPILEHELAEAQNIANAVFAHKEASKLLDRTAREMSLVDSSGPAPRLARLDAWKPGHIIDLKTTAGSAKPSDFVRTGAQYGYHIQAAHYTAMAEEFTGERQDFSWIVVEKEAPHLVSVVHAEELALRVGSVALASARVEWAKACETGIWAGYDEPETPAFPNWIEAELDDILGGI